MTDGLVIKFTHGHLSFKFILGGMPPVSLMCQVYMNGLNYSGISQE